MKMGYGYPRFHPCKSTASFRLFFRRCKFKPLWRILILVFTISLALPLSLLSACRSEVVPESKPQEIENEATNDFRFALNYSVEEIMNSPERAKSFEQEYLGHETEFFAIARNPASMLSYDGWNLDKHSGVPITIRYWSAPSKESLDIAICLKAISGDPMAKLVVAKDDTDRAKTIALKILKGKLASYNAFYKKYPGYGGFLPWFLAGSETEPTEDWKGELPGLDNGEWVWAMMTAEYVLRQQGFQDLAYDYAEYNRKLKDNAVRIFFDRSAGKVRGDVRITDTASAGSLYETILSKPGRMTYLTGEHGVHEGSMMVMFLTLFGNGLTQDEKETIWNGINMVRVEHKYGTTWQAFWGSAHESWAWLFLPFRDLPEYQQLLRIREIIRSNDAHERGFAGFPSSTNEPGDSGYISDAGIQGIGSQKCRNNDVYALYGVYPMLLQFSETADTNARNVGLAWLLNMLQTPKMQGPLGGGESSMQDGSAVSHVKTIDGTFPVLLALIGGINEETAAMLHDCSAYDEFICIITKEYQETFGSEPLNEPIEFALPDTTVPRSNAPDYQYNDEPWVVRDFDLEFRQDIRLLLEVYGWKNSYGTIEEGDISYFYEHYESCLELERFLVTKTGKELHLCTPPDSGEENVVPIVELTPRSLMTNWKLGVTGRGGWGTDGVTRKSDGTIHIPGRGWTGEMVEPPVPMEGQSYIGLRGNGKFLLEVKNMSDMAFISKVFVELSPDATTYIDIPPNNRNDKILVIAITDYTSSVDIEDIFITGSK